MRADLDVAAGPHTHGDGRAVALVEDGHGGGELDVAERLGEVAVLVVDIAQHVCVAAEVAAAQHDGLGAGQALIRLVVDVLCDDGHDAAGVVLFEIFGVGAVEPHGAVVAGVLGHLVHDVVPGPRFADHRRRTEDDGAGVVLEARRVARHELAGRAGAHVGVLLDPVGAHFLDDLLQQRAGVLHVVLDEALVAAAGVAAVGLADEVLAVGFGGAVLEGPRVVDGADLASMYCMASSGWPSMTATLRPFLAQERAAQVPA